MRDRTHRQHFRHIDFDREFTYGTDPEIFAVDANGKLLPAFKFLPSKQEADRKNEKLFWDGFQAEMTTDGTAFCLNLLMDDIQIMLERLLLRLPEGAKLTITNTFRLDEEIMATTDKRYLEFGCKPSFNVYGTKGKKIAASKIFDRWSGGHLHFGEWEVQPDFAKLIRAFDKILGVFSVGAAANLDTPSRRKHYGLAGEFRTPKYPQKGGWDIRDHYGVEYRTLSNFWMCHPAIANVMWELGRMAVRLHDTKYMKLMAMPEELVIETINTCNVEQARKLVKANEPMYRWMFKHIWGVDKIVNKALEVCYGGVEAIISDPNDLETNWKLHTRSVYGDTLIDDEDDTSGWFEDAGGPNQTFGGYVAGQLSKV